MRCDIATDRSFTTDASRASTRRTVAWQDPPPLRPRPLGRLPPGRAATRSRSTASRSTSRRGETVALVGESGSGKSVTALSVLKLLPYPSAHHPSGSIRFKGKELIAADRGRAAAGARRRHHHDLPGADDLAQPAAHDRAAGRRDPDAAPGPVGRERRARARSSCSTWSASAMPRAGSAPIRTSSRAASASA